MTVIVKFHGTVSKLISLEILIEYPQVNNTDFHEKVIEGSFDDGTMQPVRNAKAAIMLVNWLPDIQSHDTQTWLADSLCRLCTSSIHNELNCCIAGMINAILSVLERHQQINPRAVGEIL